MKRFCWIFLCAVLFAQTQAPIPNSQSLGSTGPIPFFHYSGTPWGNCLPYSFAENDTIGQIYSCGTNGLWLAIATPPSYTVAKLPTNLQVGSLAVATDSSSGTCTTGGGTSAVLCRWSGSGWSSLGGSSGGAIGGTVRVCDTSAQVGADLGARITACDILLGGTYAPAQQGNLAYNPNPTYGIIRVNASDVGPITTFPVFVSAGHTLSLGAGVYTNALGSAQPPFLLANDSNLVCDGWNTIIQNSSNNSNGDPRVVGMASTYQVVGGVPQANVPDATGFGITVQGCHFQDSGTGKLSTLTATVVLTNCHHCKALNNWFDGIGVTGVGLIGAFYSGTNCSMFPNWLAQYCYNFGDGDEVAGNEFNGTQEAISVINNQNVNIHDNKMSLHATGASGYIDLESNTGKDYMQYIDVHNNIFDCSLPQANTGCYGVTMQSVGPNDGHLKIHDNIYYGVINPASGQTTEGISSGNSNPHGTHDVEIYNNVIDYSTSFGIGISGVDNAHVYDNLLLCNGAGIAVNPYATNSVFENNKIVSPTQTNYTITSVAATVDQATTVYTGTFADGGSGALANQLVTISGFTNSANNGLFGVSTSTTTTLTVFNPAGVSETHAATGVIGCSSSLGREQNFTSIKEADSTDDYNVYRNNTGAGLTILKGSHSQIINTEAANRGTDGTGVTYQVPVGFGIATPGAISVGQLTAPVLNTSGPVITVSCSSSLTNGTYFYIVTAVAVDGTEVPSNEVSGIFGTINGCANLGWPYVTGARGYRIYRGTSSGTEVYLSVEVPQGTLGYNDPGGQTTGAAVPTINGTGNVVIARSLQLGSLTFANLPSSSTNGTMYYCSDCKNVTDDTTGTFDSAAASGGHGTSVLRENGAWRVH